MPATQHAPKLPPETPRALHTHAMDNLRFIRETMENADLFTAVPGWGGVAMGLLAFPGALLASRGETPEAFLATWVGTALVAILVGSLAMLHKARGAGVQVSRGAGRRFFLGLFPSLIAAAVLTVVLFGAEATDAIPGTWLLLYGVGVITAGAFSVRAVPLMGLCFAVLGSVTLFAPASWANMMMLLGFGGLQVVFGIVIARRHGG